MGLLRLPARADRVVAAFATKSNHKGAAQLGPPHPPLCTPWLRTRRFALPSSHSRRRTPVFPLASRFLPQLATTTSRFATTSNNNKPLRTTTMVYCRFARASYRMKYERSTYTCTRVRTCCKKYIALAVCSLPWYWRRPHGACPTATLRTLGCNR